MKKTNRPVPRETLAEAIAGVCAELQLTPTDVQHAQLLDYLVLLNQWNAVYNLTAVRDPLEMVYLHIADSLAVQDILKARLQHPPSPSLLDLGAGAGLPGIVLAIMNPRWSVTLVDAVHKKVAFMTQAAGQLKLRNVQARHGRIEQLQMPQFDGVISRAFSDLAMYVQLASPHLKPTGTLFAMQGKSDDRCLAPFKQATQHVLRVPGVQAERHLLVLDLSLS